MPKVNVYLPDALADRVREARLPVSRICQVALTQALESTGDVAGFSPVDPGLPGWAGLTPPPNHHVAQMLRQAYDAARARGAAEVDTGDILQALLDEGESLALNAVELLGFPRASIRGALKQAIGSHRTAPGADAVEAPALAAGTRAALAVGAAQAAEHGSDATTASHLLLGLIQDDGPAGEAMRLAGVTETVTPAALSAFYYGVSFGRIQLERDVEETWLRGTLADLTDRLARIEDHLGA
ncbi:Clp protease N-terminal domain-containing protein [Jiangella endophytica]|uniref:Clp protease N-terminal domain-containing protein n=1 Tax=Jiangella endophytica TaxID=1623398 RepID=UPI0018E54805|nr:Clp protease N-terminal domain-containing protein [Jiangella endophytica]